MHFLSRSIVLFTRSIQSYLQKCLISQSTEVLPENINTEKNVLVERHKAITLIGINRPKKKNSLDVATASQLAEAFNQFDADQSTSVGILYGIGGNFCAGYDLAEIANFDGENKENIPQFSSLINKNKSFSKPVVAAISGYALGVGFELALMCDMRIIEENAVLGFLNRRFGIPILHGGTVRLPALIGYGRALEIILTGRQINSTEALNWGLASFSVATGSALGKAVTFAGSLTKFSQRALLADRASTEFATFSAKHIEEALQFERNNSTKILFEEGIHGAKRFITEGLGKHGKFYNIKIKDKTFIEIDKSLL